MEEADGVGCIKIGHILCMEAWCWNECGTNPWFCGTFSSVCASWCPNKSVWLESGNEEQPLKRIKASQQTANSQHFTTRTSPFSVNCSPLKNGAHLDLSPSTGRRAAARSPKRSRAEDFPAFETTWKNATTLHLMELLVIVLIFIKFWAVFNNWYFMWVLKTDFAHIWYFRILAHTFNFEPLFSSFYCCTVQSRF